MTIDERLEGLGHNLELLSLETEKYDKHIAQLRTPATDVAGGTGETVAECGDARTPA
jgi:hypothetical protein